jgi:hypothetical protein
MTSRTEIIKAQELTKREKVIIKECLIKIGTDGGNKLITFFDREKNTFFKVKPDTLLNIKEKL